MPIRKTKQTDDRNSASSSPDQKRDAPLANTGEAEAAVKNRQIRARSQIIEGFRRLGIVQREWPDFVRTFWTNPQERQGYSVSNSPLPFDPPPFDRLNETPQEWEKRADAAWRKHRDDFLKQNDTFVALGVDEEIPRVKSTRGAGRKERNAPLDLRADWAALRLCGKAWKEIAGASFNVDQVKKGASKLLRLAGWPTKGKPPKPRKTKK